MPYDTFNAENSESFNLYRKYFQLLLINIFILMCCLLYKTKNLKKFSSFKSIL